jgi:cell wall-associated NlpC family hydrolase
MKKILSALLGLLLFFSCSAPGGKSEKEFKELGENTYGVVNLSVCNLRRDDNFSSEMITQGLLGMPVRVLGDTGWYHIQTPDDYTGWVHRAGITRMNKEEADAWNSAEKIVVTSHYGFTYEKPDSESQSVSDVVSGDRLKWEGAEGDYYKVAYPDGRKAYISHSISQPEKEWRKALKQDASSIIATAKTLLGVPYLWAGTSAKGMDCSGFVRTTLYLHDIIIPRDASQQAVVGEHIDIAPDFGNLQPGDLLFFGRKATAERKERVVHVAIYIKEKKFIHAQGDVRINSFDPADAEYDEYNLNRLLFATRILDALGTPGINTTATNPYYQ